MYIDYIPRELQIEIGKKLITKNINNIYLKKMSQLSETCFRIVDSDEIYEALWNYQISSLKIEKKSSKFKYKQVVENINTIANGNFNIKPHSQVLKEIGFDLLSNYYEMNEKFLEAAINNEPVKVLYYLQNEVDINFKSLIYNRTALHEAVRNNSYELVKLLIYKGANPNIQDSVGNTPYYCYTNECNEYKKRKIQNFLQQHGANIKILNIFHQPYVPLPIKSSPFTT